MAILLVRHLLESTLMLVLLASLASCLRRQSAAARHTIWLIAVLKFLLPTLLFTAVGMHIAFLLPASAWISALSAQVAGLIAGLFGSWPAHLALRQMEASLLLLLAVWAVVSCILLADWFRRLRLRARDRLTPVGIIERSALERASLKLGSAVVSRLYFSKALEDPALIGIMHPLIRIPAGLPEALTEPELDAILLHELVHARRRDNLASAAVHVITCLFWFHPLLWWAEKRMAKEREYACDEAVIRCGIAPTTYLSALLEVCRFCLFEPLAGLSAVSGSNLESRLDRILSRTSWEPVPGLVRALVAGLVVLVTFLPFAGGYCEQCGTSRPTAAWQEAHIHP